MTLGPEMTIWHLFNTKNSDHLLLTKDSWTEKGPHELQELRATIRPCPDCFLCRESRRLTLRLLQRSRASEGLRTGRENPGVRGAGLRRQQSGHGGGGGGGGAGAGGAPTRAARSAAAAEGVFGHPRAPRRGGGEGPASGRGVRPHHLQQDPGWLHPCQHHLQGRPVRGLPRRGSPGSGTLLGDPPAPHPPHQPRGRERCPAPGPPATGGQQDSEGRGPGGRLPGGDQ